MNDTMLALATLAIIALPGLHATLDLAEPVNNASLTTTNITFSYYHDNNASCTVTVGPNTFPDNATDGLNDVTVRNIDTGTHPWNVTCSANTTETSETRRFTIDTGAPSITLDDTRGKRPGDTLSYTPMDNATTVNCTVAVDSTTLDTTKTKPGIQQNVTLPSLPPGEHNTTVTCTDPAGNTGRTSAILGMDWRPAFNASIDQDSYAPQTNVEYRADAPNGTNLTIELCPYEEDSFVSCYRSIPSEKEYPLTETLPSGNRTGTYIIDSIFSYGNVTERRRTNYTVNNTLQLSVERPELIVTQRPITLTATAEGGVGTYNYTWTLDDGTKIQNKTIGQTYSNAGTRTLRITATDTAGNTKAKNISFTVEQSYPVTVGVTDDRTGEPLSNTTIDFETDSATTGSDGTTTLRPLEGTRTLTAFQPGYQLLETTFTINTSQTINISLTRDSPRPNVTLTTPPEGATVQPGTTNFSFTTDADECNLSVNGPETYSTTTSENTVARNLTDGSYEWNVTCNDISSGTRTLTVNGSDEQVSTTDTQTDESNDSLYEYDTEPFIDPLTDAVENYGTLSTKARSISKAFGFKEGAKETIEQLRRIERDIHDLQYRRISEAEQRSQRNNLTRKARTAFNETVANLTVVEQKSYVSDITDLSRIAERYKNITDSPLAPETLTERLERLQRRTVVSTDVAQVELTMMNGQTQQITTVEKRVEVKNATDEYNLQEHIPKAIAQDTSELTVQTEHEVVQEDPVLGFPVENTVRLRYYVKDQVSLEKIRDARTVLVKEEFEPPTPTSSVIGLPADVSNRTMYLGILVILLTAVYVANELNLSLPKFKSGDDDQYHKVRLLINDALDNLDAEQYSKASMLYREIRLTYRELTPEQRDDLRPRIEELVNRMDVAFAHDLTAKIKDNLEDGDRKHAAELYAKLKATYRKLDQEHKKKIYDQVQSLATEFT